MKKLARHEIRLSALRAAAGVALFGGALACGSTTTGDLSPPARAVRADAGAASGAGPEVRVAEDSGPRGPSGRADTGAAEPHVADGGALVEDSGQTVIADAGDHDVGGAAEDGGEANCDNTTQTADEWVACCEAIGWEWQRGCGAWGPPAPPALEEVV